MDDLNWKCFNFFTTVKKQNKEQMWNLDHHIFWENEGGRTSLKFMCRSLCFAQVFVALSLLYWFLQSVSQLVSIKKKSAWTSCGRFDVTEPTTRALTDCNDDLNNQYAPASWFSFVNVSFTADFNTVERRIWAIIYFIFSIYSFCLSKIWIGSAYFKCCLCCCLKKYNRKSVILLFGK